MIRDIHGNEINERWLSEFRGFFYGEGYLGITTNGTHNGWKSYTARAQITLRMDELPILNEIHAKLGGDLTLSRKGRKINAEKKKYQSHPLAIWRARNKEDVLRVCDILKDGILPSKKKAEIETIRKFYSLGMKPGKKSTEEKQKFADLKAILHQEIKDLHQYREPVEIN